MINTINTKKNPIDYAKIKQKCNYDVFVEISHMG